VVLCAPAAAAFAASIAACAVSLSFAIVFSCLSCLRLLHRQQLVLALEHREMPVKSVPH
jgi:hypothetical protein